MCFCKGVKIIADYESMTRVDWTLADVRSCPNMSSILKPSKIQQEYETCFSSMWLLPLDPQRSFLICFRSRYYWNSCFFNGFLRWTQWDVDMLRCHNLLLWVFHHRCYLSFWTSRFFLDEKEEGKAFLELTLCFCENKQQWLMTVTLPLASCFVLLSGSGLASLEQQYCQISLLVSKCVVDCPEFQSVAQRGAELPHRSYFLASGCLVKTLAGQVSEVSRRMQQ